MENAGRQTQILTARDAGLVGCRVCAKVHLRGTAKCVRCGSPLRSRDTHSLQHAMAWLFAGLVMYIPANIYPMLLTTTLGQTTENTIIGGVIDLMHHGSYGIAAVVFVASVLIPIGKFIAIIYLALSIERPGSTSPHRRQQLFEVVEFIGRWSMIDVFVVAILSALVQLQALATVNPGIAAISFALSVVFTMLSALSFDSRTIWDSNRAAKA